MTYTDEYITELEMVPKYKRADVNSRNNFSYRRRNIWAAQTIQLKVATRKA